VNSRAVEPRAWTQRRWWTVVAALVAAQAGLVFWLGDKSPVRPRQANNEPTILWVPTFHGELTTLHDPTLFAWANPHGFSRTAWLEIPSLEYQPFEWTEPPRFLAFRAEQLGEVFRRVVQERSPPPFEVTSKPEPQIFLPELEMPASSIPAQSSLRVEGDLAGRRLLSQFNLPSWPASDILSNSVVQVIVDADGQTQSATLLSGSGSKDADDRALDLAKSAEWEPLRGQSQQRSPAGIGLLSWGRLVFSWRTVPPAATNAPHASP
jgi:TonB family protein